MCAWGRCLVTPVRGTQSFSEVTITSMEFVHLFLINTTMYPGSVPSVGDHEYGLSSTEPRVRYICGGNWVRSDR